MKTEIFGNPAANQLHKRFSAFITDGYYVTISNDTIRAQVENPHLFGSNQQV